MELTKELLPHLSEHCKVVNVSSTLASLDKLPEHTALRYSHPQLKEKDISDGIQEFLEEAGKGKMINWYPHAYSTSKMLLNAWSRFVLQYFLTNSGSSG